MKKAIVTGATGFIGEHLCKSLLDRGFEVYGLGRDVRKVQSLLKKEHFHFIKVDFEEYKTMEKIVTERGFDFFIHTALSGVSGIDKKNYDIQLNNAIIACEALKSASILECTRFVMIGSVDEFEAFFSPDDEYRLPNHARIYGLAKFAAENIGKAMASELGIEYVSALLTLTYGEGNNNNVLPNLLIRNSETNTSMKLIEGENYFDMIYIDDAIEGILAVAERGRNMESYFVGHEELKTFKMYVEEICSILESSIELNFGTYKDSPSKVDFEKIRRNKITEDTGFECKVSLEDGILKTRKWLLDIQ